MSTLGNRRNYSTSADRPIATPKKYKSSLLLALGTAAMVLGVLAIIFGFLGSIEHSVNFMAQGDGTVLQSGNYTYLLISELASIFGAFLFFAGVAMTLFGCVVNAIRKEGAETREVLLGASS